MKQFHRCHAFAVRHVQVKQREVRRMHGDILPVFPQGADGVDVGIGASGVKGTADSLDVGLFVFDDQEVQTLGVHYD